jgi:hypothetical protein
VALPVRAVEVAHVSELRRECLAVVVVGIVVAFFLASTLPSSNNLPSTMASSTLARSSANAFLSPSLRLSRKLLSHKLQIFQSMNCKTEKIYTFQ